MVRSRLGGGPRGDSASGMSARGDTEEDFAAFTGALGVFEGVTELFEGIGGGDGGLEHAALNESADGAEEAKEAEDVLLAEPTGEPKALDVQAGTDEEAGVDLHGGLGEGAVDEAAGLRG